MSAAGSGISVSKERVGPSCGRPFAPRGKEQHPRAAEGPALEAALRAGGATLGPAARLLRGEVRLVLPVRHGRPIPSAAALREPEDYEPGPIALRAFEIDALF